MDVWEGNTIQLTDSAMRNLENMSNRVLDIETKYGVNSNEGTTARFTFSQMLMTIIRWPGKVHAEDDLSLIINSSITIGIIWHSVRHMREDGSTERDPLLGSWSSHS